MYIYITHHGCRLQRWPLVRDHVSDELEQQHVVRLDEPLQHLAHLTTGRQQSMNQSVVSQKGGLPTVKSSNPMSDARSASGWLRPVWVIAASQSLR